MLNIGQLKTLGLSEDEAKVYLACLALGETTLAPLARNAAVPRTNTYLLVESLLAKGLLSKTLKGKRNQYSVSSPEKIKEIALEEQRLAEERVDIAEAVSREVSKILIVGARPQIQYFHGRQGLRSMYEDLLSSGEVKNYYIGSLREQIETVGEEFLKDWAHRRVEAGIFSYAIRTRDDETPQRVFASSRKMMREVRFAPEDFRTPLYMIVYGNRVAFMTGKKEKMGFIVESEDFSVSMRSYFDVIWAISEPVDA